MQLDNLCVLKTKTPANEPGLRSYTPRAMPLSLILLALQAIGAQTSAGY
jgi:hypothetical protein